MEDRKNVEACGEDGKTCAQCQERASRDMQNEESSFAVLLALVPALVLSLFSVSGLM